MKRRVFLTAVVGNILPLLLSQGLAQPSPDTLWTRTYGGNDVDVAYSVQQTADGGYVVAGYTLSFGAGEGDFYLVKTNSQGDTLWTRTCGGSDWDVALSVQQTTDGSYFVGGYTWSFGTGGADFYLVKTNDLGDTLWTRTYGGSDDDGANSVQLTSDGGCIMAGHTNSFGAGSGDFYLVKTNSQGDTLWTRTYGGSDGDEAYSVQQTSDGGYVIIGNKHVDLWLVKTDSQGDTLWTSTWRGISPYWAYYCVQQTTDSGYIVAGDAYSDGGDNDFYLAKTNSTGMPLWERTYGGYGVDIPHSVQQTSDGGYIVAGRAHSFGTGEGDFYLVKTNSQGDTLWTRTYGGSLYENALSIQQTADGGYIVAGSTNSFGAGETDFYLVKTGPDISETEPARIAMPNEYILHPAFPNPFNPSTQITFALPKTDKVSLRVFNLLGEEVVTLVDEIQSAGIHTISFNASGLPSGVYLCRFQAGDFVEARKMVLLK